MLLVISTEKPAYSSEAEALRGQFAPKTMRTGVRFLQADSYKAGKTADFDLS